MNNPDMTKKNFMSNKFDRLLRHNHSRGDPLAAEPEPEPETPCQDDKQEAEDQLSCEFLTDSFLRLPAVLLLLAYLQIVSAIPCLY